MEKDASILNDSIFFDKKEISSLEYRETLIRLLTSVLIKRFPNNYQKQQIRPYKDRITCSCPYCGDSTKSDHKKRGNFILEGKHKNYYKCFNCGEFRRADTFFKNHGETLDLNVIDYIIDNLGNFKISSTAKYDASILLDLELIDKYAISREELKTKLQLIEIKGSSAESWLRKRLQFQNERMLFSPIKNYIAILNLTPSGKILGLQTRKLNKIPDWESKYLTYKLSKLYTGFRPEEEVPEEVDSISEIFGIFQLNFNLPINLFEGPFDSFLMKNSIASTGAHKSLPLEIKVRHFLDLDETGTKKSIQYMEENEYVFLWEKLRRDVEFPYRKKWDLNDLMIWALENKIKLPRLENYFSNDPLDLMDL